MTAARASDDPIGALGHKPRSDRGRRRVIGGKLAELIRAQHAERF